MDEKSIGARIKLIRAALKLTQKAFASSLGVEQGYISYIERGLKNPSEIFIGYICLKFNISESWLREGKGEMFVTPEETIKQQIARYGEQAILDAVHNNIEGKDTASLNNTSVINNKGSNPYIPGTALKGMLRNHVNELTPTSGGDSQSVIDLASIPDTDYLQIVKFLTDTWQNDDGRLKDWIVIQFELAFPDVRSTGAPADAEHPELAKIITYLHSIFKSSNQQLKNWATVQFEKTFPEYVFLKKENREESQPSAG